MSLGECFTLAGYLVGAAVYWWAARQRRVDTEGMGWLLLAGLCSGVLGARLTEWLLGPEHALLTHPQGFFDPESGGRTIVGGILCGWLGVEWAKKRLGIMRSTGDLFAVALPAGEILGRIGCFFNGCCYGTESHVAWAVYQHAAWRHPSQLYMAGLAAVTLGVVLVARTRLREPGDLFRLYIGLYALGRFAVEFFRDRTLLVGDVSLAQLVCLGLATVAFVDLWRRSQGGELRPGLV